MVDIVKRAGDVVGTPDWQLELMYGTETAQMLEEQAEKSKLSQLSFDTLNSAHACLKTADLDYRGLLRFTAEALGNLNGTPEGEKLHDLLNQIEDISVEIRGICERVHQEMMLK